MAWNFSTTGRHEDVVQAVRDYSGTPAGIRVPPDNADVQLAQIEQIKIFVLAQLLAQGDRSGAFTVSVAGEANGSIRIFSINLSAKVG